MTSQDRAPGLVWFGLRSQWRLVLAIALVLGLLATAVLQEQPARTYVITKAYLVALRTAGDPAAITDQGDRLARDYASVLTSDSAVLDRLGERIGTSGSYVRRHLKAGYVPAASTIVVRFTSSRKAEPTALFGAMDILVETEGVPSSSIPAGLLRSLGTPPTVTVTNPLRKVPGTGFVLALLVAVGVGVLLERSRPRVVNRAHLQTMTNRATLSLGRPESIDVLAVRVLERLPSRVLLTSAGGGDRTSLGQLSVQLTGAAEALVAHGTLPAEILDVDVRILAYADLTDLEELVAPGDSWVVVVGVGERLRAVEQLLAALDPAGDVVVVLAPAPKPRPAEVGVG